jgi:rRNA maturation RNase YbeY
VALKYRVEINVEAGHEIPDLKRLQRLARSVLAAEGVGAGEVGVVLTDDPGIQVLNRQYLAHDYPTDVLSFGMRETVEEGPAGFVLPEEEGFPYIGDVAISLERAREQAATYGHDWTHEVEILLIHGLLHLLGYDDGTEAGRERMEARQESLHRSFTHPRSMADTFRAAFKGLANLLGTQRNIYIHLAIVAAVLVLAAVLGVSWYDWLFLILAIALVLVTETMNTAVEVLVDLVSPEHRPLAGRAKDLAAAAVLLAAFFAVAVGALVFAPHLWRWVFGS